MNEDVSVDLYGAMIAELESKIVVMQTTISNLQSLRGAPAISAAKSTANGSVAFTHDAFFGMSAAEAAKKYLTTIRKTATINTICDALIGGGWKTAAKNPMETLRTIISRTPDFVRINGEFGLTEWYPGRKVQRSKRVNGLPESQEHKRDEEDDVTIVDAESHIEVAE